MKNEDKIIELLAEMVKGQDVTNQKLEDLGGKFDQLSGKFDHLDGRVGKLEKQIARNNLQIAENSRAILKLAENMELVVEHEKRISSLERTVYK